MNHHFKRRTDRIGVLLIVLWLSLLGMACAAHSYRPVAQTTCVTFPGAGIFPATHCTTYEREENDR